MTSSKLNRRQCISSLAATAATAVLLPKFSLSAATSTTSVPDVVPSKLAPFPLSQVRLRPGIFLQYLESNQSFVESLPNDRLLHTFRLTAGIPSSADPLGGWEHPTGELRGHFTGGHLLSACALLYAATGNDAVRQKGNALVAELAKCQAAQGPDGYLGAYPVEFYDRLKEGKPVWAPFYTYHKILAGHLDMYNLCGNEQALATAEKMAAWTEKYLQPISNEQWAKMQLVEHGGMNESLFNLYAITGKEKYLALARRFDHAKFFDPLAQQRDELKGLHANTNIPKVIGAARGYEVTGDARYRTIADYFWREVVTQRTYCTGGTSDNEGWNSDPGILSTQLGHSAEECCCSYNMMKLTRHIFSWTGDPSAMDYYERTLFNSRLGTQDADGMKMYYLSLQPGLWKTFGTRTDSFWCCTGTGAEEFAKLADTIYFHDAQGIYVNLFIASELNWPEKNITLLQETDFPEEQGTTLTIKTSEATKMQLHIRVPYWATRGLTVSVNGKKQDVTATPSSYLTLDRLWNSGDKIQISMPMSLHLAPTPDDPTRQAAMFGPLVLAGRLASQSLPHDLVYGPMGPDQSRSISVPEIISSGASADWLEPVHGQTLTFRTVAQPTSTTDLIPLYQLFNERYTVYWKLSAKSA
jgi:DUF1680 family protein